MAAIVSWTTSDEDPLSTMKMYFPSEEAAEKIPAVWDATIKSAVEQLQNALMGYDQGTITFGRVSGLPAAKPHVKKILTLVVEWGNHYTSRVEGKVVVIESTFPRKLGEQIADELDALKKVSR